jgi:broad specificity phosphatase PhoE
MRSVVAPALVVTSPFLRCVETASELVGALGTPPPPCVTVDAAVCEWVSRRLFAGSLPGDVCPSGPGPVVRARIPAAWESPAAFEARCAEFAAWLCRGEALAGVESVVVVTHGYCVVLLGTMLDPEVAWASLDTGYCCLSHFVSSEEDDGGNDGARRWVADLACSTSHLMALEQ